MSHLDQKYCNYKPRIVNFSVKFNKNQSRFGVLLNSYLMKR